MVTSGPVKSIYIHIPFCIQKCNYCNFVSFPDKQGMLKDYFIALGKEINCSINNPKTRFSTVYIGGGTPSVADSFFYEKLLSLIPVESDAEITMEVNPGTVNGQYLEELKKIGINRLSIGVQSFDNCTLKTLNRLHTAEEVQIALDLAKKAGFNNISIDLMYGLPGQTLSDWEQTLIKALEFDVQHISTYGLKIEEGTPFHLNMPENLPDEDEAAQMYLKTIEILEANSFIHYEISNFCRPGCESRHNLAYWDNEEYYGFGAAAHGYSGGVRYSNSENLEDYIANPLEKLHEKKLSEQEIIEELIFLGLRQMKGVNILAFNGKYDGIVAKYTAMGLMKHEDDIISLTPQGILLSNNILAEFIG